MTSNGKAAIDGEEQQTKRKYTKRSPLWATRGAHSSGRRQRNASTLYDDEMYLSASLDTEEDSEDYVAESCDGQEGSSASLAPQSGTGNRGPGRPKAKIREDGKASDSRPARAAARTKVVGKALGSSAESSPEHVYVQTEHEEEPLVDLLFGCPKCRYAKVTCKLLWLQTDISQKI